MLHVLALFRYPSLRYDNQWSVHVLFHVSKVLKVPPISPKNDDEAVRFHWFPISTLLRDDGTSEIPAELRCDKLLWNMSIRRGLELTCAMERSLHCN